MSSREILNSWPIESLSHATLKYITNEGDKLVDGFTGASCSDLLITFHSKVLTAAISK